MFPVNKQTMSVYPVMSACHNFTQALSFFCNSSVLSADSGCCLSVTHCNMLHVWAFLIYDLNAYSSPTFALSSWPLFWYVSFSLFPFWPYFVYCLFCAFWPCSAIYLFHLHLTFGSFHSVEYVFVFCIENSLCKPKVLTSISGCFGKDFLQFLFLKHWKEENCQFCLFPCLVYVNILIVIFFSSFFSPFILGKIWRALLVFDLRLHALSGWYFYPS